MNDITLTHEISLPNPAKFPQFTWRPAHFEDAYPLNQMLVDIEALNQTGRPQTIEERERDFKDPDSNPETDTLVAITPEGQFVALGWVFTPPPGDQVHMSYLWVDVHPRFADQSLVDFMIDWTEARGRQILAARPDDLPHELWTYCWEKVAGRIAQFKAHGYQPIRYFYHMQTKIDGEIPETALPEGLRLENWSPALDEAVLEAYNASFRDHWGFFPTSVENWQLNVVGDERFRPELSYIALAADAGGGEQVVGFSINQVRQAHQQPEPTKEGWINELGVIREWRQRGVATALLRHSLQAFKAAGFSYSGLGVDTDNLTGALRIYERLGYRPIETILALGKRV